MANPQKENGYTPIANELTDRLCGIDIPGSHFRVLLVILRKTYGYSKKTDKISLSQFRELTGLSNRTVIRCIQDLEAKKMIHVVRLLSDGLKAPNEYRFEKDYDNWVVTGLSLQTEKNRASSKKRIAQKRGSDKHNRVVTNIEGGSDKHQQLVVTNNEEKVKCLSHTKTKSNKTITKEIVKVPIGTLQGVEWQEIIDSFKPVNPFYERFYKNKTQRQAITDIVKKCGKEKLLYVIKHLPITNKLNYFPNATTPIQLRDKWAQLEDAYIRRKREAEGKDRVDNQKVDKL